MAIAEQDSPINQFDMEDFGGAMRTDIRNIGDLVRRIEQIERRLDDIERRERTPEMVENNIVFGAED